MGILPVLGIFARGLLVREGGLCFYSRDFQSLGLKLTPMTAVRPYKWRFKEQIA
jgi:hypothetical protein